MLCKLHLVTSIPRQLLQAAFWATSCLSLTRLKQGVGGRAAPCSVGTAAKIAQDGLTSMDFGSATPRCCSSACRAVQSCVKQDSACRS